MQITQDRAITPSSEQFGLPYSVGFFSGKDINSSFIEDHIIGYSSPLLFLASDAPSELLTNELWTVQKYFPFFWRDFIFILHIYSPGKSQMNLGKTIHTKEFQPTFLSPPKTAPFLFFMFNSCNLNSTDSPTVYTVEELLHELIVSAVRSIEDHM